MYVSMYIWRSSSSCIHVCMDELVACATAWEATSEEKKEALEALAKYDMLTEDESRQRFTWGCAACSHICACTYGGAPAPESKF